MLGDMLREARTSRGLSLSETERGTKIRQKYLAALEDDNLSVLPSPVYARGFLRNYALYLEMDPDEVLRMFDEESQPTRNRIRAARGEPAATPRPKERKANEGINIQPLSPEPIDTRVRYGSSYIAVSLLALPLIIAFYFIYSAYAGRGSTEVAIPTVGPRPATVTALPANAAVALNTSSGSAAGAYNTPTTYVPQAPSSSSPLPPISATLTITAQGGTAIAQAQPVNTIQAGSSIVVSVSTTRDAWMQVLVDGVQKYNGTMAKGLSKQWTGKSTIRIRTGRADSVHVRANGTDLGFMGTPNNLIVEKEWNKSGAEKIIVK